MTTTPRRRRSEIAETLRRRIVSAVSAGASRHGDRLPSAREVAAEFEADPRLVLAAYRILAREGLVSIRRRSGIYVAAPPEVSGGPAVVAPGWLVDVLTEGLEHGVPAPRLGDWLRRCISSRRLRVAVVAESEDQLEAYCAELREDYGFDPVPFFPDAIERPGGAPPEMLAADLVVATEPTASTLRAVLGPLQRRVLTLEIRSDLDSAWRRVLAQGPLHVVLADVRTVPFFEHVMTSVRASGDMRVLVVGRDDLSSIPPNAPVHVSRAARRRLDGQAIPGRILPPTRAFTAKTMRELLALAVDANLTALKS